MTSVDDAITNEQLSAYLDGELGAEEKRSLERHLASSAASRDRLEGLRRVVGSLRGLGRTSVPPTLHPMVARHISLERERVSWVDRLEGGLSGLGGQSPLLVTFAVVISLALFIVLFSISLNRAERRQIVVVDSSQHAVGARLEKADRALFWTGTSWSEGGFVDDQAREIDLAIPEGVAWLDAHPELRPLRDLGEPVEIDVDGERIRLLPAPGPLP